MTKQECDKKYYQEHRKDILLRVAKYRLIRSAWVKEYRRRYYQVNKKRLLTKQKVYGQTHRDQISAYHKQYHQEHDYNTIARHNYQARKRRALGVLTIEVAQRVYEDNIKRFGTLTCYLCLKPIEFGQDCIEHKTPLARGGSNLYENLAVAHRSCNNRKCAKTEAEYRNG